MLHEILTGQTKGVALLSMAFSLFFYFVPFAYFMFGKRPV